MKLAVTGKGGVGKTTVTALLARTLSLSGLKVIVIDADPNISLAACMGHPAPDSIRPLIEMKDLIEERTGVKPGTIGGMFILNPAVSDIADRYAVDIAGVKVLVAGGIKKGGTGCYCPENALLRALISHLMDDPETALVVDMEAGLEHLGRGTVDSVDALLVVSEPSSRGTETAQRIRKMAGEIGLKRMYAVGNKVRSEADSDFLTTALKGWEFAGNLMYDEGLRHADISRTPAWNGAGADTMRRIKDIAEFVIRKSKKTDV